MVAGFTLFGVLCFGTLGLAETRSVPVTAAAWKDKLATISAANTFVAGESVTITGVTPGGYNGTHKILWADNRGFSFTLDTDPGGAGTAFGAATPVSTAAPTENPQDSHNATSIGAGLLGSGIGPTFRKASNERAAGVHYLLPFEIVSVHLLVVLIGAAYLARAKKRKGASA
jgi:hypothetical protein